MQRKQLDSTAQYRNVVGVLRRHARHPPQAAPEDEVGEAGMPEPDLVDSDGGLPLDQFVGKRAHSPNR